MTNADKIRQMSDEELAVWLCMITAPLGYGKKKSRLLACLDWLKQEVEE